MSVRDSMEPSPGVRERILSAITPTVDSAAGLQGFLARTGSFFDLPEERRGWPPTGP